MNEKINKKFVLNLFILLFLISSAYAQITINEAYVYGQNSQSKGFVGKDETVMLFLNASENNDILSSDYRINISYPFLTITANEGFISTSSCTPVIGNTKNHSICRYATKKTASTTNTENFDVKIYNNTNNQLVYQQSLSLKSDITKPQITVTEIEDPGSVSFQVVYNDGSDCSGISKIEVLSSDGVSKMFEQDINSDQCSGTLNIAITPDKLVEGTNHFKIKVYDKVGNFDIVDKSVQVDQKAEFIAAGSFKLYDTKDKSKIDYCIKDYGVVDLKFSFTAMEDVHNVIIDASDIGGNNNIIIDYQTACKSSGSGIYSCSVQTDYSCDPDDNSNSLTKTIDISLSDRSIYANSVDMPLTTTLKIDKTAPKINSIVNIIKKPKYEEIKQKGRDTTIYIGKKAIVKVDINEESTIDITKSYLKISEASYSLTNCNKNESSICLFESFDIEENEACKFGKDLTNCQAELHVQDRSGNSVTSNFSYIIDNTAPVLSDIILQSQLKVGRRETIDLTHSQYVLGSDKVNFFSRVNDLPNKIYFTKSDPSTNVLSEEYSENCKFLDPTSKKTYTFNQKVKNVDSLESICEVSKGKLKIISSAVDNGIINVLVSDFAGNFYETQLKVVVLEHETNSSNLFAIEKPELMQKTVTRDSAKLAKKLAFKARYKLINSNVQSEMAKVVINKRSCKMTEAKGKLETPVVDFVTDSTIYFNVDMRKSNVKELSKYDKLEMVCNASIFAIKDGRVLAKDVKELVFEVPLSYDPQSSIGNSLDEKIKDAQDDSKLKLAKKLKGLRKFYRQARKLCNFIKLFGKISAMMNGMSEMTHKAADATPDPATRKGLRAQADSLNNIGTGLFKSFEGITKKMTFFCGLFDCNKKSKGVFGGALGMDFGLGKILQKEKTIPGIGKGPMINPHGSLVGSIATLCIPGIIDNLDRYRMVKCTYIDCLKNKVPRGMPIQVCEQEYKYTMCKYETGQKLALIPFLNIFQSVGQGLRQILENPLSVLMGNFYNKNCQSKNKRQQPMCKMLNNIKTIAEMKRMLDNEKRLQKFEKAVDKICKSAGVD